MCSALLEKTNVFQFEGNLEERLGNLSLCKGEEGNNVLLALGSCPKRQLDMQLKRLKRKKCTSAWENYPIFPLFEALTHKKCTC